MGLARRTAGAARARRSASARCPTKEWDAIAALGFDAVWLMGVWERSPAGHRDRTAERRACRELPARAPGSSQTRTWSARRTASATTRSPRTSAGPEGLAYGARGARAARPEADSRLRAEPRRARPRVDVNAPGVLRRRERGGPRARPGLVCEGRRPCAGERPRSVLPGVAGRRAAERVLDRPARRGDRHARSDRRAVRRCPLRHGDADDERRLRAHLGRARR